MATSFVTRYDLRAPGVTSDQRQELFARAVEQAAYADAHGHDAIMVSEHHAADDGYLPSPLLVASAFAAVTTRIPITVSALLVNLYEPVRLAEDLAVLDLLSRGRVSYTLGLGYRPVEYELYDRPWSTRGRDIEARIERVLELWSAGTTTPAPYSEPHPFLFYGGGSPAAARRAARLGLNFQPQHGDPALQQEYDDTCRALGREPGFVMRAPAGGPANVFCADDPDAFWERYGHHLLADARAYQEWHGEAGSYVVDHSRTVEEMREAGVYLVTTPDDLVDRCRAGLRLVTSHPACGGLPAEPSWASLRAISEVVLPAVRG